MYNFVNCLQFNIRYKKVERPAPVGGALVKQVIPPMTGKIVPSLLYQEQWKDYKYEYKFFIICRLFFNLVKNQMII
jgi:hypothetical protein